MMNFITRVGIHIYYHGLRSPDTKHYIFRKISLLFYTSLFFLFFFLSFLYLKYYEFRKICKKSFLFLGLTLKYKLAFYSSKIKFKSVQNYGPPHTRTRHDKIRNRNNRLLVFIIYCRFERHRKISSSH